MGKNPQAGEVTKIYSPIQVACGAFVGGPAGVMYFLQANFNILEQYGMKQKTIVWGLLYLVLLTVSTPFLPENIPNLPFTIAYVITARLVAEKYQMKKVDIIESDHYEFYSNWRVFGLGLLCLLVSFVAILVPLLVLDATGIVTM
ncbi:MAG: hypothetical protein COA90_06250 [Gammaproteobacteria bacterium]|nr:MAG: hypothetical protein COA90_06250 [Gammaproteobacteria bacterium]